MGANSVKGLKYMETIYPSGKKGSVIPQEKLDKAIKKGEIAPDDPNAVEEIDGDMDEMIDKAAREVFAYYDPKGTGKMDKKAAQKFFTDSLEIYALRKGVKSKDLLGAGITMKAGLESAFQSLNESGTGFVSFDEFQDFLDTFELDEVLSHFTGQSKQKSVAATVEKVDTSQFANAGGGKKPPPKLVYRDYGALED